MDEEHLYVSFVDTDGANYCSVCDDDDEYNHFTCECGEMKDLSFLPDPYDFDINNRNKPSWTCSACYKYNEALVLEELANGKPIKPSSTVAI